MVHNIRRDRHSLQQRENLRYFLPVLRIRNVYPGSQFFHPGHRVKKIPDPRSASASKNLSISIPKTVSKLSETRPGMFVLDPRSRIRIQIIFPTRIQGSKKHRMRDPCPQHCFLLKNQDPQEMLKTTGSVAELVLTHTVHIQKE